MDLPKARRWSTQDPEEINSQNLSTILLLFCVLIEKSQAIDSNFYVTYSLNLKTMRDKLVHTHNEGGSQFDEDLCLITTIAQMGRGRTEKDALRVIDRVIGKLQTNVHRFDEEVKTLCHSIQVLLKNETLPNMSLTDDLVSKEVVFQLLQSIQSVVYFDKHDSTSVFHGHCNLVCLALNTSPEELATDVKTAVPDLPREKADMQLMKRFRHIFYLSTQGTTKKASAIIDIIKPQLSGQEKEEREVEIVERICKFIKGEKVDRYQEEYEVKFIEASLKQKYQKNVHKMDAWEKYTERPFERIGRDIEDSLNIKLKLWDFQYFQVFNTLKDRLKIRPRDKKHTSNSVFSVQERKDRIHQTLMNFPLLLKFPDAFSHVNNGKLFNFYPQRNPVYGPPYEQTMNQLFEKYGLGDRSLYLKSLKEWKRPEPVISPSETTEAGLDAQN